MLIHVWINNLSSSAIILLRKRELISSKTLFLYCSFCRLAVLFRVFSSWFEGWSVVCNGGSLWSYLLFCCCFLHASYFHQRVFTIIMK